MAMRPDNLNVLVELPLVTIVIPAYNHAHYLPQAVQSVLAQDYPRVELVVIDDGSTDETAAVLGGLGSGFRWFSQTNRGQSLTLARGWSEAQGDILGYLSADDVLLPSAVSAAVNELREMPDLVAVYPDFNLIDPYSHVVRRVTAPNFDYNIMLTSVFCPIGPGAMFTKVAYLLAGPWSSDFRQMPDYDFWLRLGLVGKIKRIPKVLAGFRVHEGSQTYSVTNELRADEPIRIVDGLVANPLAARLTPEVRREARVSAMLVSAQLHLRAGRFASAFRRIKQAVDMRWDALFSLRTLRLLLNPVFNRLGHRLLWTARAVFKR
jgi:glycosyltransferase involved in cell wall biosynthesis